MTREQFERMSVGDEARHVRSRHVYRVTSKVSPFVPRFRKVSKKGTLQGEARTFLPEHLEVV
jgi:hypothetical protein